MKTIIKERLVYILLFTISIAVALYYFFYQQVSSDNIILFLGSRFYQSQWLNQGVFPLYNPNTYAGFPFAGDLAVMNFHPFSFLFLIPFPFSISFWTFSTTFIFLIGFYLFFRQFTQTKWYAFIISLALFVSGSGIIRIINPTVFSVVSHIGLFMYSLSYLKKNKFIFPIIIGILLTLSGHIQIVFYGYLLGLFSLLILYKVPFKKVFIFYLLLFICTFWFYALSIPIVLSSTRITKSLDYKTIGDTSPLHFITWFLPYLFGEVRNGSKWNVGIPYQLSMSLFAVFFMGYLFLKKKISKIYLLLFILILFASMGLINFPFFRGAVQIYIVFHIILFTLFSQNEQYILQFINSKIIKKIFILLLFLILFGLVITSTDIAYQLFDKAYLLIKHGKRSLFYDPATIRAIIVLIQHSLFPLFFFSLLIFFAQKNKIFIFITICFLLFEGGAYNYLETFTVPTKFIKTKIELPSKLDLKNYRIQTAADTIPYFGFFVYYENIYFRQPFSKEKSIFKTDENKTFKYFLRLQDFMPLGYPFDKNIKTLQTYSTFTPKKTCDYFQTPSVDWITEYKYITDKNPLFGIKVYDVCTNSIETSRITMYDPRWEKLAVRYLISDRPLKKYKLVFKDHRYFYENENAPPIYGVVENSKVIIKSPYYEDPNQMKFKITQDEIGKTLQIIINPDGFVIEYNGKNIKPKTEDFKLLIPLTKAGELKVYYSPIDHLMQTVKMLM